MPDFVGVELGEDAKEEIINVYLDVVASIIDHNRWSESLIHISRFSLAMALAEAAKDVRAIQLRRKPGELSRGKIAGIITFRLARWGPIQLSGGLEEDIRAVKLNSLVAFVVSLKHIINMNITDLPPAVTQEFNYTLLRRHTNQETLGLVFDVLDFYSSNIKAYLSLVRE